MKPTLNSHTITHLLFVFRGVREPQAVCHVAPANAQTQAWQRVSLFQRSTKTTDKPTDEKKARLPNSGFAKKRVQWLIEHSSSHQILWLNENFELRNQLLRKAAKRKTTVIIPINHREKIPQKYKDHLMESNSEMTSNEFMDWIENAEKSPTLSIEEFNAKWEQKKQEILKIIP